MKLVKFQKLTLTKEKWGKKTIPIICENLKNLKIIFQNVCMDIIFWS